MPLLRLLFAGLVALFAMLAVVFTAAVVLFSGLVAWLVQLFGGNAGSARTRPGPTAPRRTNLRTDDAIDVEATKVPDDTGRR
jgi:hypothetical protein